MKLFRGFSLFGSSEEELYQSQFSASVKRDENGRIHTPLYSSFFADSDGLIMRSNYDYGLFRDELLATVEPYSPKENVVVDLFETSDSDPIVREATVLGFKRFVSACYSAKKRLYRRHLIMMLISLVIGIISVYTAWTYKFDAFPLATYLLETVAAVLLWQCIGYFAYSRDAEIIMLRRLAQILRLEFNFRHWE